MSKENYITKSKLKSDRNWTDSLIKRFLGASDKTAPNSMYNNAAPIQLYLLEKVLKTENTDDFKQAIIKRDERKLSSQKAVETKKKNLLKYANNIEVKLSVIDDAEHTKKATYHYEQYWADKRKHKFVDSTNTDFMDRIKVNYLRHSLSNYENELYKIHGKTGVEEAVEVIRKKVYSVIAEKYPHLKEECKSQLERREIFDTL